MADFDLREERVGPAAASRPGTLAVLVTALRLVMRPADWRQGDVRPPDADDSLPPYCAGAAIAEGAALVGAGDRVQDHAERLFGLAIGTGRRGDELTAAIVEWNDRRGRTHDDIVAAFERACRLAGGAGR